MATLAELAELRIAIQEPNNVEPYTDDFLDAMIDAYGVDGAAGRIWEAKAASVSKLVDISEGGSSRKMSQVFANYKELSDRYKAADAAGDDGTAYRAPRTRKATRV